MGPVSSVIVVVNIVIGAFAMLRGEYSKATAHFCIAILMQLP